MTATLVDFDTFAFADGNGGHSCDFGAAPSAGALDVLCVNSNTVVSTPSGWTLAESRVTNQGAYIFCRFAAGGEGSTVTVTTSGNHNTIAAWSRWGNCLALDTSTSTEVNSSTGGSTPAHDTGVLAEDEELLIAFGAMHSIQSANQSDPAWSAGYSALTAAIQGSSTTGVLSYVGYRLDAGTAAETPQVSWSGAGAFNRYMLAVSFTTAEADDALASGAYVVSESRFGRLVTATALPRIVTETTRGRVQ